MAVIRCQACGKPNPDFLSVCQYCEAALKPVEGASAPGGSADETLISAGSKVVRCQACGKTNPAEREICQYCQARLKPLGPAAPSPEAPAEPESPDEPEAPSTPADWLSRLRGAESGPAAEPDWMWTGQTGAPEGSPAADDDLPAWLTEATAAAGTGPASPGEDLPAWMRDGGAEPAGAPPSGLHTGPAAADSVPHLGQVSRDAAEYSRADEYSRDDLPEWLQEPSPPTPPSAETTSPPRRSMTDWLSAVPGPGEGKAGADDAPDWLKSLAGEAPAAPRSEGKPASEAPASPQPPTLSPLRDQDKPSPLRHEGEPEAETPDWLQRLRAGATPEEPPAEGQASPAHRMQVLPAWMRPTAAEVAEAEEAAKAAAEQSNPPAEPPAATEAAPEAAAPTQAPPPPAQPAALPAITPPPADPNMPDWLNNILTPPAEAPSPLGYEGGPAERASDPEATLVSGSRPGSRKKMTDWLGAAPARGDAAPEGEETVLPDWLSALAANAASGEPEAATPVSELPDWLKPAGADEPPAEIPRAPTPAIAPASEDSLPEWLQALRPDAPEAAELPGVPTDTAGEMPEWLATLAAGAPTAQTPAEAPGQTAQLTPLSPPGMDDETLAWLGQLSAAPAEAAAAGEAPLPAEAEAEATLDLGNVTLPPTEPEWMAELAAASAAPQPLGHEGQAAEYSQAAEHSRAAAPAEPELAPTPDEELPDWLRALRGMPAEEEAEGEDLPDWLRTLRGLPPKPATSRVPEPAQFEDAPPAAPAAPAEAPAPGARAEGLSPERADLPAWLAAMRPIDIDQPVASEADVYEETLGVLAGMRGVLRAEPAVAQPHKAATPVHRLEVSPAQTANAQLLIDLLQSETTPRPVRRSRARLGTLVERWVIFAVLALAIGLAQFQWPGLFPPPLGITPEAENAFQAVVEAGAQSGAAGTLPRPVLVAFDYEPAQQGELSPGAQAIVRQVLGQGVPVVAVSARPAGAAVGQQLLEDTAAALAAQTAFSYTYGTHYLNLGFLPGGPVGLLQFASAPKSAFQDDFTGAMGGGAVWQAPALAGVKALSDFGLIVVVADTPQAARAWVEQAQQYAGNVKMVAVVSASAEPLVRPYTKGGANPQLDGLVVGLAGAARYEQHAGLPGEASARWPALGGGLLAAALMIAAGNLVFGLLSLVRRRR